MKKSPDFPEEELVTVALAVPEVASPQLRRRLLDSVDAEPFSPFVGRLATLLDLGRQKVERLLQRMDQAWETAPWPGVMLQHLEGGPSTAGCDVGFVKVEAGQEFPYHVHGGTERVLVLQGGFVDSDGSVYRAGAQIEAREGHHFVALPGVPLIYAVVVPGVEFPEVDRSK